MPSQRSLQSSSSKQHKKKKTKKMNAQSLTNTASGGDVGGANDEEPSASHHGLHQSVPSLGYTTTHGHIRRPRDSILRRRSSEPAVNARKTFSPTARTRKKRQQSNHQQSANLRELYRKSLSSNSLQSPSSRELHGNGGGNGHHQVHWELGTAVSPTAVSEGGGGVILHADNLVNIFSQRDKKKPIVSSSYMVVNGYNSAPTSRPSTPPLPDQQQQDGFGTLTKSPNRPSKTLAKAQLKHRKSAPNVPSSSKSKPTTRARKHRTVDPSQRMSRNDFQPIEDMFGDFAAVPGSPSLHKSMPASGFGNATLGFYDPNGDEGEEEGEEDLEVRNQLSNDSPPRLWDSMPDIPSTTHDANLQGEAAAAAESSRGKKERKHKKKSKSSTVTEASPKSSPSGKRKKSKRLSATSSRVPNIEESNDAFHSSMSSFLKQQQDLPLGMETAHTSPSINIAHKMPPVIDFETDHSPTSFTAVTAGTSTTTTSTTSLVRRSTSSTVPSKDDLFLIEMEKFRAKSEHKQEVKERAKLKKQKSKRKHNTKKKRRSSSSLPNEGTPEFDVDDQSDGLGLDSDDDLEEQEEEDAKEQHPDNSQQLTVHNSKQHHLDIEWKPPAYAATEKRMPRRASMPPSLQEFYEPVTPSFVKKTRKPSKVDAVPAHFPPDPFGSSGDYYNQQDPTATAVDAILNPDAAGMGGFSGMLSKEEAFEIAHTKSSSHSKDDAMSQSHPNMTSSGRSKKARSGSMGHHSETLVSSRRGPSARLDKSRKSTSGEHSRKSSKRASKAKRRGSTSVLEMSSSHRQVDTKPRRRGGSTPPKSRNASKDRGHSRSKSPGPRKRTDMDVSTATGRSKMTKSSRRGEGRRRGSDPEGLSTSRRDKLAKTKKPSYRRANSASPSRRSKSPRPESKSRHKSPKPTTSVEKSSKRSGVKSGSRKSSSKRRSSMPSGGSSLVSDAAVKDPSLVSDTATKEPSLVSDAAVKDPREKPRTKSKRSTHDALSQSQPVLSSSKPKSKKKKSRSKSIEHARRTDNLHVNGTKSSSKSPRPTKGRRRASMSSAVAPAVKSPLECHIVSANNTPTQQLPSGQSSWSALTLSTAQSDEKAYSSQKQRPAPLKRNSSWSDFDLLGPPEAL